MASPAEIAQGLPETLPDDFSGWDNEASHAPGHSQSSGPKPVHGVPEASQSFTPESIVVPATDPLNDSRQSGPVFLTPQKSATASGRAALWLEPRHALDDIPATPAAPIEGRSPSSPPVVFLKQQKLTETERAVENAAEAVRSATAPSNRGSLWLERKQAADGAPKVSAEEARGWDEPAPHFVSKPKFVEVTQETTAEGEELSSEAGSAATEETAAPMFLSFRSKIEALGEQKAGKRKFLMIGAVGCAVLLIAIISMMMLHHGKSAVATRSVQPVSAATFTPANMSLTKESPAKPLSDEKPVAGSEKPMAGAAQPSNQENSTPEVESQMMDEQLSAPAKISQDVKKQMADNAPPPPEALAPMAADGLGGSNASYGVFNGHGQPVVKAAPAAPVTVSAGVANGMLIQKTAPVYPQIAKSARISGTVELQATISKTGAIKDVHVVNGPVMLRQAALDAVRTWRYKPYQLNNQPTDVDTTINVVFSLQ